MLTNKGKRWLDDALSSTENLSRKVANVKGPMRIVYVKVEHIKQEVLPQVIAEMSARGFDVTDIERSESTPAIVQPGNRAGYTYTVNAGRCDWWNEAKPEYLPSGGKKLKHAR